MVAKVALDSIKPWVNRAFKVTCAVYKEDAYKYHSTIKESNGGYYEFELKNSEDEIFTFVYKRTMHSSEGIDLKSNEVLGKLRDSEPAGIVTLTFNDTI